MHAHEWNWNEPARAFICRAHVGRDERPCGLLITEQEIALDPTRSPTYRPPAATPTVGEQVLGFAYGSAEAKRQRLDGALYYEAVDAIQRARREPAAAPLPVVASRLELVVHAIVFVLAIAAIVALLAGCGDNATAPGPDGGADAHAQVDAGAADARAQADAAPAADAELLGACADVCPADELTPWPSDTAPIYWICLPSYRHCEPPTCAQACDVAGGATITCSSGVDCRCSPPAGVAFTCVGAP